MSRELKLMTIPEIMEMATRSVDFQGMDGLNWWTIFSGKVSHSHFDAIVDEIQANGFGMPIVLCDRFNDGQYWIGNGHHRLCAAILLGLWRIPVMVTSGQDRDDYMCEADSMDDWNKPISGYSFEYWEMLRTNMESIDFDYVDEDADNGGPKCGECEYDEDECICAVVTPDMYEWQYIYCQDCNGYGYAMNHRACGMENAHDLAIDEHYGYLAERDNLIRVGAILGTGAWHPEAVLRDAYADHEAWMADEPLRAARAAWEEAVDSMREAALGGASIYVITYWAGVVDRANQAYEAL